MSDDNAEDHLHNLRQLLQRLQNKGLRCRLEKCVFAQPRVKSVVATTTEQRVTLPTREVRFCTTQGGIFGPYLVIPCHTIDSVCLTQVPPVSLCSQVYFGDEPHAIASIVQPQ